MSESKKRRRRHFSSKEKVAILKRHLLEDVAVSDLCDELALQPRTFYRWQQEFFENGESAFESANNREGIRLERRIGQLEDKLQRKNEVLSELMEEHLQLKKNVNGEL